MNEIELLPQWYKENKQKRLSLRIQYAAAGILFVVLVVWNVILSHSVAATAARIKENSYRCEAVEAASQEFSKIQDEVKRYEKRQKLLNDVDNRLLVSNVLGELSWLIDRGIVISRLSLQAQAFKKDGERAKEGSSVRVSEKANGKKSNSATGKARFEIVMDGLAANAEDIGQLICSLEDSSYFRDVYPSYSRSKVLGKVAGQTQDGGKVSEFEIQCYLANYHRIQQSPQKALSQAGI